MFKLLGLQQKLIFIGMGVCVVVALVGYIYYAGQRDADNTRKLEDQENASQLRDKGKTLTDDAGELTTDELLGKTGGQRD